MTGSLSEMYDTASIVINAVSSLPPCLVPVGKVSLVRRGISPLEYPDPPPPPPPLPSAGASPPLAPAPPPPLLLLPVFPPFSLYPFPALYPLDIVALPMITLPS